MTKAFFTILGVMVALTTHANKMEYVYLDEQDSSKNCYLAVLPDSGHIKGLILRDFSALPDTSKKRRSILHELAADSGYVTVFAVSSSFFPELFLNDSAASVLDNVLHDAILRYKIPVNKIFIGGISASGTRALRFAQYCQQNKSKYGYKMAGVFAVDPPLDHERFYFSSRHILYRKNPIGNQWEAQLMIKTFDNLLGGDPKDYYQNYLDASVFTYSDSTGGNAKYYARIPIILFHEPDINWWLEERGESYYEINSVDIAAFVVSIKHLGNHDVTLVTTENAGFDAAGDRKPHSWSIVDEEMLLNWILSR